MNLPYTSRRAAVYDDIPDEKWNDWRWQLSHRLNSVEEIGSVITLTDSERTALSAPGLFRVDITPYFISFYASINLQNIFISLFSLFFLALPAKREIKCLPHMRHFTIPLYS